MKNLLLAAILLSTIACNGSGGGPLKVDPETNKMIKLHYTDVECEDTETLICKVITDDEGEELERPTTLVDYYSIENGFSVDYTLPENTDEEKFIANPVTTTTDLRALEGVEIIYNDNGTEYQLTQIESNEGLKFEITLYPDLTVTFLDEGKFGGNRGKELLSTRLATDGVTVAVTYSWELRDEVLVISKSGRWQNLYTAGFSQDIIRD